MGLGTSKSTTTSTAEASSFIAQQFAGTCDITCNNIMSNVSVDLFYSNVGGDVNLTQTCSSNPTCIINSSFGATTDTLLKAANSSNAKNASKFLGINFDSSKINNTLDIRQNISQNTTQTCNIGSLNQMDGVSILAENSNIGGSINLTQTGSTSGSCSMSSALSAAAAASGGSTNNSQSGKDKLGQKKGSKSGKLGVLSYLLIGGLILIVIVIIGRIISSNSKSNETASEIEKLTAAKLAAGCPDGAKPLLDPKTLQPIINPQTHGPMCPAPKPTLPKPQEITINLTENGKTTTGHNADV